MKLPYILIILFVSSTAIATATKTVVEEKTVIINEQFLINITTTPTQPIKGWEMKMHYDPAIITINSVVMGNIFKDYIQFNSTCLIDASSGSVTKIYNLIVGKYSNVSYPGTLLILNCTAISTGVCYIGLYDFDICNETQNLPHTYVNGSVTVIAQPEKQEEQPPSGGGFIPPITPVTPEPPSTPSEPDNHEKTTTKPWWSIPDIPISIIIILIGIVVMFIHKKGR